jgi:hypothetical protein
MSFNPHDWNDWKRIMMIQIQASYIAARVAELHAEQRYIPGPAVIRDISDDGAEVAARWEATLPP